jgi:hypothetical protein
MWPSLTPPASAPQWARARVRGDLGSYRGLVAVAYRKAMRDLGLAASTAIGITAE